MNRSKIGIILAPFFVTWYLLTLAYYRILVHYIDLRKYNPMLVIGVAVIISLGAGFVPKFNSALSISRTLMFLPFFFWGIIQVKET